jgi:HPt (histidine-containing phosphotransfer) domain-containing protein
MLTVETLTAYGANAAEGLARCFGNETLYFKLVRTIPAESGFDKLAAAIGENDLATAFEHAHSLKGILGNLSLTPLYEPICAMTEKLRAREQADYQTPMKEILRLREELGKICE